MLSSDSSSGSTQFESSTLLGGPISKWTNIIKGWQNRFVVLDYAAQTLYYYTSEENYRLGERRGAVRLRGSVIGINDDDDCMFTITTNEKAYHFQARNPEECERWIQAIQKVADSHQYLADAIKICGSAAGTREIAEVDGYLQLLLTHISNLEVRINNTSGEERDKAVVVLKNAKRFAEAVKYAILSLQLQKSLKEEVNDTISEINEGGCIEVTEMSTGHSKSSSDPNLDKNVMPDALFRRSITLYSSSDEENLSEENDDFFDALDEQIQIPSDCDESNKIVATNSNNKYPLEVYDACYDDILEDESQELVDCSIFVHLLSQVKLGMDLTRVTLPTFILERRSFLEMVADFLAHPDLFVSITDAATPKDRFISVVRWYLSAFHAGRRSVVPKKPYNPILGEIFQCYYNLSNDTETNCVSNGPVPWARSSDVSFVAEQVSHHPPVSAYYAECVDKKIEIEGWIWTKSRFLGLSVGVNMIGVTTLRLLKLNEEYTMTFPSAYGRSILSVPWFELGGKVYVECKQTGYRCDCEFLTKPFYGGKKHRVIGTICGPDSKCLYTIDGEWNEKIDIIENDMSSTLFDVNESPIIAKAVKSIKDQEENESRRLWKDVTFHLKHGHVDKATDAKRLLEDKQRADAAHRQETGTKWIPKLFKQISDNPVNGWTYTNRLSTR